MNPCISIPLLILKNRFVVDIFQIWHPADNAFSVMSYFLVKLIILHIQHSKVRHFHQNLRDDIFSLYMVI